MAGRRRWWRLCGGGAAVEAFDEGDPIAVGRPGESEDGVVVVFGEKSDGSAAGGGGHPDLAGFGVGEAAAVGENVGWGLPRRPEARMVVWSVSASAMRIWVPSPRATT
jgi:hypothetical protein